MQRTFCTLVLALQFLALAQVAIPIVNAEIPFPQCWPCPDDPPAAR